MEDDLNGRQPCREMTSMKYDENEIRPFFEDNLNGRGINRNGSQLKINLEGKNPNGKGHLWNTI